MVVAPLYGTGASIVDRRGVGLIMPPGEEYSWPNDASRSLVHLVTVEKLRKVAAGAQVSAENRRFILKVLQKHFVFGNLDDASWTAKLCLLLWSLFLNQLLLTRIASDSWL